MPLVIVVNCRQFDFTVAHLELGDPVDDLAVATVLMVVGGQLVLLRPRKVRKVVFYALCISDKEPSTVWGSRSQV